MSPAPRRRTRLSGAAVLAAASLVASASPAARADAGDPVAIDAPTAVWGLRVADADGDGVKDLLVVSGRDVHLWLGAKGKPFPKAASAVFHVPEGATFVAPGRVLGAGTNRTPTLLALGREKVLRVVPGAAAVEEGLDVALPWSDPSRAVLGDFAEGASLFLPTPDGVRWVPDWLDAPGTSVLLPLHPVRTVVAPGGFVEDGATVRVTWPKPFLVRSWAPAGGAPAVFSVGPEALHAFVRASDGTAVDRTWPTTFLGREGDPTRSLVDFDADGTPDLVHAVTTNDSGAYVFLRTPPPAPPAPDAAPAPAAPLDLRPARGSIRLKGFQLPLEFPDLDGDGRPDVVVTTMDIDGSNVTRAVLRGRVLAKTRAFLNRSATGAAFFAPTPDAVVESEIGVQILFTYSGSIDVKRSFTILTTADLDGDRRKDLVIRTGPETLSVYRGAVDGVWSSSPIALPIPNVGKSPDVEGYAGDLDGDGKDDLVLLYRAPPGGADRTVVRLSR